MSVRNSGGAELVERLEHALGHGAGRDERAPQPICSDEHEEGPGAAAQQAAAAGHGLGDQQPGHASSEQERRPRPPATMAGATSAAASAAASQRAREPAAEPLDA